MRRLTLPGLLTVAALALGCAGTYSSDGVYATASYTPELVYVSPGVSVVAGYPHPVFYSSNYYWRYDRGRWYRSPYWDRGWVYAAPPRVVARIDDPYRYRYYRPGYTVRRDRYGRPYYSTPYDRSDRYRYDRYPYEQRPIYRDRYGRPVY